MTRPDQHRERPRKQRKAYVFALLAALVLTHPPQTAALALGEPVSVSAIGQPLRAEIRVTPGEAPFSRDCLRNANPGSADGIQAVSGARLDVVRDAHGTRIVVTHPGPVFEPMLRLVIESRCGMQLTREYILLLSPPTASVAPAPPTASTPSTLQHASASSERWTTAAGESATSLAQALYPRDAGARKAFVSSVLRDNPAVYSGTGTDRGSMVLPTGTQLVVPHAGRIAVASSPSASRPARSKADKQAAPSPRADHRDAAIPPETVAARSDRLLLRGEEAPPAMPSIAAAPATPREQDEAARERGREDDLVEAIDRTINVQLELLDRIRRLEEIQERLRSQLAVPAEAVIARDTAPDAASDRVPQARAGERPAERTPLRETIAVENSNFTVWGLLVLLLIAVVGIYLIRRLTSVEEPENKLKPYRAVTTPASRTPPVTLQPGATPASLTGSQPAEAGPAAIAWHDEASTETSVPARVSTPLSSDEDAIEDHDSAIELAEIMVSFGRVEGATETLADFIRANPKRAVTPWLKLMELYYKTQKRSEFEALARHLNKTFNVSRITWENFGAEHTRSFSLEHLPHIAEQLVASWRTRECQQYIETLLRDNRDGTRQGFPLGVIDDLLILSAVLEDELGRYKPPAPA